MTTTAAQPLLIPATAKSSIEPPPRGSVREMIFQTIVDVHNSGRAVSRPVLVSLTGLTYSVVDDHVKRLVDDGRLRRVINGVFEPVEVVPPTRAVSFTKLPSGMAKLEIGDICVDLNPSEERAIARMLAGSAAELSGIQNGRELADSLALINRELEDERRIRRRLEEAMQRMQLQLSQAQATPQSSAKALCEC